MDVVDSPPQKNWKILLYSLFCIFPQFRALAPMYYRGSAAAIIVYDITKEVSFCNVTRSTLCSNFCYASVRSCNISGIWQQSSDECTLVAILYPGVITHTTPTRKNKQKKDTSFSCLHFLKITMKASFGSCIGSIDQALLLRAFCSKPAAETRAEEIFLRQIFILINRTRHDGRQSAVSLFISLC